MMDDVTAPRLTAGAPLSPVLESPMVEGMEGVEEAPPASPDASTPRSGSPLPTSTTSAHRRSASDCPDVRLHPPTTSTPETTRDRPGVALEPASLMSAVYGPVNGASPNSHHRFLVPNSSFSSLSSLVSVCTEFSVGEVDGASVRSLEADGGCSRSNASLDRGVSEDSGVGEERRGRRGIAQLLNSALYKFSTAQGPGRKNGVSRCATAPASTTALILNDRPDGLPAKDPKESKRHAAEYLKLVERIKKDESEAKRRQEDEETRRFHREMRIRSNLEVWRADILPTWTPSLLRSDRHRRNMLWDGVPGPLRDRAWPLMVANDLNITEEVFQSCLSKLRDTRPDVPTPTAKNSKACAFCSATCAASSSSPGGQSLNLICSDIVRTFPKLSFFQVDGPQHRDMVEVIGAYAFGLRPEVGYCQGMSFLAAVLLLNLPSPYEAFVCLANLLNRPVLASLYGGNMGEKFNAYRAVFDHYLMRTLPELYLHFEKIGLDSRIYLLSWLLTLFSSTLPLDCSFRVWDLYLVDGDSFLFRAALGLLRSLQPFLLKQCYDLTAEFLTKMIPEDTLNPTRLFQSIRSVAVDSDEFYSLLEEAQREDCDL